jgi:carbon monoxide dehydrogenase subunit G
MPLETFAKTIRLAAEPRRAWEVLTDVQELATWVGIIHSATEIERLKSYTAVLQDRVGPFSLRADLLIDVAVIEDGEAIDIHASCRDRTLDSKIDIDGNLRLAGVPSGGSELSVCGRYQVTGRAAALGAGIVRKKGDVAIEQFFSSAARVLGAAQPLA